MPDNRPLKFEEWEAFRPQTIYVYPPHRAGLGARADRRGVHRTGIRPNGLIDPICEVRQPKRKLMTSSRNAAAAENGTRVLVTTLTKKMAEALTEYMHEAGIKVRYVHSDVDTLERIEIIRDLRLGVFDVLIGINLLREGLDIPECALVGILDGRERWLSAVPHIKAGAPIRPSRLDGCSDGERIPHADKIADSANSCL